MDHESGRVGGRIAPLGALVLLVSTILLAVVNLPLPWPWVWHVAAGAVALSILFSSVRRRWSSAYYRPKRPPKKGLARNTVGRLLDAVTDAVEPDEVRRAKLLAYMITYPEQMRQRVVEEYEPGRRTLRQKVTIDLVIDEDYLPQKPDSKIFVPLLVPRKGDLHDDLEVRDASGGFLATLSHHEYLVMIASTIRLFLKVAERDDKDRSGLERQAVAYIAERRGRNDGSSGSALKDDTLYGSLKAVGTPEANTVAGLVRRLSDSYAIIAVVDAPLDGRLTLSYSRTIIPTQTRPQEGNSPWAMIKKGLRLALGARPVFVELEIENAWTCNSYHMQVRGPEGLYLAHQRLDPPRETGSEVCALLCAEPHRPASRGAEAPCHIHIL